MSSSDAGSAASSSQQSQSSAIDVVIRMPSAATEARDGVTDPFAAMRIMAASSGSTGAQVSSSTSSADGALHRSLQALSDTLAHTKAQQKQQEDIMAAKLMAKGKRIATSAKFAADPATTAPALSADPTPVAQSASESDAAAPSVQSQNDSTPSPVARPARANKPRRAVRFADVDEGDESGEDAEASASTSTSGSIVAATAQPVAAVPAPANPSAASDFDAFLAAQWGSTIGAIQSRTAAAAAAGGAASTPAPSASAAPFDADGTPASSSESLPSFVSVDPVSLCSFLHFRAPLSKPRIPTLAELCCSALATLAQEHELDPEAMGIGALPTHVLEACIAGTKRPRTRSRAALPPAPAPVDQRAAQDNPMAAPSRPGLRDSHLLPFLHPQLDRLSLDAEGTDAAGGGLQGLAEVLAAEISPRLLDVVASRCLSLQHLNLGGYSHAFSPAQILALARLPLRSLSLAHCRVAAPELRLMLAHCDHLRCLNIGWTSCVLAEFGSGSMFGGGGVAGAGTGGEGGALDDILCVLSRPELRASLRRLNVDGARADPDGLLSALLGLLPRLEALEMDSVSPSSSSSSSNCRGSDGEGEGDQGAEERARAIEQLVADNAALKVIFEQQLKLQRERAAEAAADQSASGGLGSCGADGSSPAPAPAGTFRYPHLRSLSAVASSLLSEESMLLVAAHAPNLTALDLKGCGQVSNALVALLAANCRGLQRLGLADCQRVDSEAIWVLRDAAEPPRTRLCGSGRTTKVDGAPFSATGAAVPSAQSSFPAFSGSCLRAVDFSWCENLSNQSLACLFDMRSSAATATQASAPPLSAGGSTGADSESTWSGPALDWDGCRGGTAAWAAEEDDPAPPCPFGLERVVLSCVEDLDESTAAKLAKHARIRELDLSRCLNLSAAAIFGEETAVTEDGHALATANAAVPGSAAASSSTGSSSSCSSSSSASLCPSLPSPLPWSQLLRVNLAWTSVRNCDLGLLGSRCPRLQWLGVEGCKQLDDGCVAALMQLQPGSAGSAESAGRSALFNLAFVSFFFVNNVSMSAVVQLIRESRGYWITVRSYYGDLHDPDTVENDEKEL